MSKYATGWLAAAVIVVVLFLYAGTVGACRAAYAGSSAPVAAESRGDVQRVEHPELSGGDYGQIMKAMQEQGAQMNRDMAQIKREIAALREEISQPGIKEVFAGIGYILGLAGVGFYFHSRRAGVNK